MRGVRRAGARVPAHPWRRTATRGRWTRWCGAGSTTATGRSGACSARSSDAPRRARARATDRPAPAPDCLLAVPTHPTRLAARGFDHGADLARWTGRAAGVPGALDAARRIEDTGSLAELSRAERSVRIRGAFRVSEAVHGRRVALVDDVLTTGATAGELARECHDTGAASVELWGRGAQRRRTPARRARRPAERSGRRRATGRGGGDPDRPLERAPPPSRPAPADAFAGTSAGTSATSRRSASGSARAPSRDRRRVADDRARRAVARLERGALGRDGPRAPHRPARRSRRAPRRRRGAGRAPVPARSTARARRAASHGSPHTSATSRDALIAKFAPR